MSNLNLNVLVAKKRSVHVSTNATAGVIDTTTPVTIKTIPVLMSSNSTLESLSDVVAVNETTGDTLVYDSSSKTWIAKKLDISNVTGNIDGGTF